MARVLVFRMVPIVLFLALCAFAAADTVKLSNGDVISGKVLSMKDGKLTVETEYMGTVALDAAKVVAIVTDKPVSVTVTGGNTLVGSLTYDAKGQATVTTQAAPVTVPAADLLSIGAPEAMAPPKPRWTGSFEIGINGQEGNKETFAGNAAFNIKRQVEDLTIFGYALGRYSKQGGVVSENYQRVGGRTESKISDKAFWYTALDLERDEFKDLTLRTVATIGLGRTWWQDGDDHLKTLLGVGFTHESFESGGSKTFPTAEAIADYSKKINNTVTFTDRARIVPDLSNLKGWRAENDAAFAWALTEKGEWKMKLGVTNQYDNDPPVGIKNLDTYYYLNAVRGF